MLPLVSKRGVYGKALVTRMINMNYKFITITHSLQTNGSKRRDSLRRSFCNLHEFASGTLAFIFDIAGRYAEQRSSLLAAPSLFGVASNDRQ